MGCQAGASLGTTCTTSSACASPLVCRLGRCRNECTENRDCPLGAQCFLDGDGLGACQLDVDRSCGAESCGTGLTCLGSECVRACSGPSECPVDGTCAVASGASVGVCVDPRTEGDAGPAGDDGGAVDGGVDAASDAGTDAGTGCGVLDGTAVCTGVGFSCAIRTDTSVVCWGVGDADQLGVAPPTTICPDGPGGPVPCAMRPITVPLEGGGDFTGAVELGCGEDFACARLMDGHVRCWGRNYRGMLGAPIEGILGAREVVDTGGIALDGATRLAVGDTYACAQRGASSVWCWGDNTYAQLGRGTTDVDGQAPAEASALDGVGDITNLFVMADTTCVAHMGTSAMELHCLGHDDRAQLGFLPGTPDYATAPTLLDMVPLDATHPTMSTGDSFACAIGPDGLVRCWGWNEGGSLGRLAAGATPEPIPAPLYGQAGTRVFTTIFAGSNALTTCGVTSAGLYCWGSNGVGQAAQDPVVLASVQPTIVAGLPTIATGACGQQNCCAVDTAHTVWCWGANSWAQLGRGAPSELEFVPGPVCAP